MEMLHIKGWHVVVVNPVKSSVRNVSDYSLVALSKSCFTHVTHVNTPTHKY